jgi:hypothetical protein
MQVTMRFSFIAVFPRRWGYIAGPAPYRSVHVLAQNQEPESPGGDTSSTVETNLKLSNLATAP